ncbi:MAG: serine/threonine-protein phosphatase [Fretibacterium sp.]|nr:serine/threonine-protein phosphatase [Fretibacterium sp.]
MKAIMYSYKGPVREHNEDAVFAAGNVISGCSMLNPAELNTETPGGCFAAIDGMGGYEGGEKAARLVAMSFLEDAEDWDITMKDGKDRINNILKNAVRHISDTVAVKSALASMGAALAGIALCADGVLVFNCGDCRVYRQQGEYLERLSHDHSVVQELCDRGEIDEDAMRTHPAKNRITACVSADLSFLDLYFREVRKKQGTQRFFFCSDGVWEALSIDELESCLAGKSCIEAAEALSGRLLELGEACRDNVSFVIVEA